eukprot:TRINITY_DN112772_c0_g1_i1.p1 TRINITY_DN112772_c0_g1~~TRINITY_DN112772_c0_g1_i1.p1  ORF type:complete len:203 (-),score=39.03 TRINITY_DN112772_c0_g1_i1:198-728(-)
MAGPSVWGGPATVHWRPGEAGLYRASLNKVLGQRKLDVTEAMMKAATVGRASELGTEWEPPGMISRRIADLLTKKGGSAPPEVEKNQAALTELRQQRMMKEELDRQRREELGSQCSSRSGRGSSRGGKRPTINPLLSRASSVPVMRGRPAKPQWALMMPPARPGAFQAAAELAVRP